MHKKELDVYPVLFPMPVLMNLDEEQKTASNLKNKKTLYAA